MGSVIAEPPVRVLFIAGMGRSGSTLLDRMLGRAPGVVSVGEIRKFWRRAFDSNELCGCGQVILDCLFWRAVLIDAWGGLDVPGLAEILTAEDRLTIPLRQAVPLRFPRVLRGVARRDFARMTQARTTLFRSVARVSGASLVIDSSKGPLYGLALGGMPELDVRVLHLVRDSRAVAHSWMRAKDVPKAAGQTGKMPTMRPTTAARLWVTKNVQIETQWAFTGRSMRLHYEAFVEHPDRSVSRALRFAGHEGPAPGCAPGVVELPIQHTVLGNPMRFDHGPINVKVDDAWRQEMPRAIQRQVMRWSLPLMARYGYIGPLKMAGLGRP